MRYTDEVRARFDYVGTFMLDLMRYLSICAYGPS